jgi:hypothetical protein
MSGQRKKQLAPGLDFNDETKYPEEQLIAAYHWEFLREAIAIEPEGAEIIHPFFPNCQQFPDTPYSELPQELKETLAAHPSAPNGTFYLPESWIQTSSIETLPHVWHDDTLGDRPGLALLINWNLSPNALKKRFSEIVEAHRTKKHRESRGRARISSYREKLRFLAAKRAWKAANGDFKKAYEIWPYSKIEGSWRTAEKKADKVISGFRRLKLGIL